MVERFGERSCQKHNLTQSGQIKTGFVCIAKDFVIYVDGDGETVNGFEQKTDSL